MILKINSTRGHTGSLLVLYKDCDDTVLKSLIKNTISFCLFVCLFIRCQIYLFVCLSGGSCDCLICLSGHRQISVCLCARWHILLFVYQMVVIVVHLFTR